MIDTLKSICLTNENVDLKKYNTFKLESKALGMVFPSNLDELKEVLNVLNKNKSKYFVIGNGSNIILPEFYDGIIISLSKFNKYELKDNYVYAESGCMLNKLASEITALGYAGLDFATGIPGTIGGAIFMNAGAYKSDIGYVTKSIEVLTPNLEIITMTNKELDFHYRTSFLQKHKDYICLEATFQLRKNDKDLLLEIVEDRKKRRLESQPLEYPSAGSVFRNPENNFAGKLIEDLGYKGYTVGGAKVSDKHANFIINHNNAKAEDIKNIIEKLQKEVKKKSDIDLKVWGSFILRRFI